MKTIVLDARDMQDRISAHTYLADRLSLPAYYGRNLDALYDCLTEISEPTNLVLYRFPDLAASPDSYLSKITRILKKAAEQNQRLRLLYDAGFLDPES
jgi:ribonuclease inhibitor